MLFKFVIVSDEVDDFRREIVIDSGATFLSLHKAIVECVGFERGQMASFFVCDDNWGKGSEITLFEMDSSSDMDIYLMEDTALEDLLEDEREKLLYVFDYMTERAFFMELVEVVPSGSLGEPICKLSKGKAPAQVMDFADVDVRGGAIDIGEEFYGDSEFNVDELDRDGFDGFDDDIGDGEFGSDEIE